MNILLHNHSTYPMAAGLAADVAIAACVDEQLECGVDVVTDGGGGASHTFAPGWPCLDGVESGPTVSHGAMEYLCPVVSATPSRRTSWSAVGHFGSHVRGRRKAVLPGPYTLAVLACEAGRGTAALEDLAMSFSIPLAQSIGEAAAAGVEFIQIEEPAPLWPAADFRILRRAWEPLWEARGESALIMATYGGDASGVYAQLNSVAADWLAVDLASAPDLAREIAATGSGLPLILGLSVPTGPGGDLVDDGLVDAVERMFAHYPFEELHLQPACGLGGSTRADARATLVRLASLRDALNARAGFAARRVGV